MASLGKELIKVKKQKIFGKTKIEFQIDNQTFVLDVDYENKNQLEFYRKSLTAAFDKYAALKIDDQLTVLDCKIKYSKSVEDLIKLNKIMQKLICASSSKILEITNNTKSNES